MLKGRCDDRGLWRCPYTHNRTLSGSGQLLKDVHYHSEDEAGTEGNQKIGGKHRLLLQIHTTQETYQGQILPESCFVFFKRMNSKRIQSVSFAIF